MRTDLEAAMAGVIGSRAERRRFFDDPRKYAESFSLEPVEIETLIEMGPDIADLTGGFVKKREGYLRMNAARTLEMLGPQGDALIGEFTDAYPMPEWHRFETETFGQFLIERTQQFRDGTARSDIVADIARFEKHRQDSFWEATLPVEAPVGPDSVVEAEGAVLPPADSPTVKLRTGANTARFEWDVRLFFRYGIDHFRLLQPDPCQLLFFYDGSPSGFRVLRLQPFEVMALEAMSPGTAVEADVVRAALPDGVDLDRLLSRFVWQEVVEWL